MRAKQELPSPREGLPGVLDRFVGPGATPAELVLQFVLPLGAAVVAVAYAAYAIGTWSTVQYILCAVLAFDIVGGIITNATSSGKRWYHRAGQGFSQHFGFVTLHLVHLALISWLFLGLDLSWLITAGVYLLVAGLVIISSPLYLRRPIALLMYTGSVLLALYALEPPPGMEWFLPLFYLKLLVAHLPKEEAYRPKGEANHGFNRTPESPVVTKPGESSDGAG
ncbi:hypothetical protein [Microbulbifer halophilus]|uniref:Uncharacterized protein n=1 Tax=Microbulbifer halophilus TaxID=453963 RepID=A0ABW5EFW1_9GAMM|nr:hypothetical protein [Microbulbifer halophilus]MCW8127164.1 hypothetical protein [Microbulbifer halophilus]